MAVRMASPFDELAELVGRVLARRWLREQQSVPSVRRDAAETQASNNASSAGADDEDEIGASSVCRPSAEVESRSSTPKSR